MFSSNYSLLKHTNYIHIYVLRNPAPHYKVRLQTCVYHIQSFELLVCLLIFFHRWQLGIDEINSIFLFFTPKETDVSHFHKVYGSFRLTSLIKINEYCQTKGSLFTKIAFCTFLPIAGSFFLPFPFLFSFSFFYFPFLFPFLFFFFFLIELTKFN